MTGALEGLMLISINLIIIYNLFISILGFFLYYDVSEKLCNLIMVMSFHTIEHR